MSVTVILIYFFLFTISSPTIYMCMTTSLFQSNVKNFGESAVKLFDIYNYINNII